MAEYFGNIIEQGCNIKLLTSAAHLLGFKWLKASISVRLEWILKGIPNTDFQLNVTLFGFVHYYIIETNRFTS